MFFKDLLQSPEMTDLVHCIVKDCHIMDGEEEFKDLLYVLWKLMSKYKTGRHSDNTRELNNHFQLYIQTNGF